MTIKINNSRVLGFTEYGDPQGSPVFYFHGFPGSRLEASRFDKIAAVNQFRIIGLDRPGMGLSSYDSNRSILSWSDDVAYVADHLGINKFSIIGHSGGGPFVAACAYAIPDRIKGAAIVSGMAPIVSEQIASKLIVKIPGLATMMMKLTRMMLKNPKMLHKALMKLPDVDRAIFHDPVLKEKIIQSTLEAFHHGVDGPAQEMKLLFLPWRFDLKKITFPVTIWHGALDTQSPVSHAKIYADLIPQAQLMILENEGHHSIMQNRILDILRKCG